MPSLAGMEMGTGAVTSAPELSPHFKADPQTCLPRLSKEFSSVLTPFICFLCLLCLPGFQLEAKTGTWGGQPITGTSPAHIRAPKKVQESSQKGSEKPLFEMCRLEWAPRAPNSQSPGIPILPQECLVLLGEGLVLIPHSRHLKLGEQSPPELSASHLCLTPLCPLCAPHMSCEPQVVSGGV